MLEAQDEGGFERGNRQLVDAQSTKQRVLADAFKRRALAGDDAGLRTAEQLVAAKGDDIHTCLQTGLGKGFVAHSAFREVEQATAAQILDHQQMMLPCELDQFL